MYLLKRNIEGVEEGERDMPVELRSRRVRTEGDWRNRVSAIGR